MEILSVNELCVYIGAVIDSDPVLADVWVEGEVSNCKRHSSGHWYLTLKENDARIDAACWRSNAARLTTLPRDGLLILAHGKIGMYNGRLQLYIDFLRPAGEGLLQAQFERLKAQLEAEGLFARKRPLPTFPRRIGFTDDYVRRTFDCLERRTRKTLFDLFGSRYRHRLRNFDGNTRLTFPGGDCHGIFDSSGRERKIS